MTEGHWYFYYLPIGQALVSLLIGIYLLKRAKKSKRQFQWSIGISLIIASACAAIALLSLYVEVRNTDGFGSLVLLVSPVLPPAVIALVTTLSFCVCVVWGSMHDRFVSRMGFLEAPSKSLVGISVSVLAIAGTLGVYLLLPTIHLLPYGALSSGAKVGQITLTAHRFSGEFVSVILLESAPYSDYKPSFHLDLDWRGRVVLDVWHEGTETQPEETVTYYLPFRESAYRLDNGSPVAIGYRLN